jgi:hypothetical protein
MGPDFEADAQTKGMVSVVTVSVSSQMTIAAL